MARRYRLEKLKVYPRPHLQSIMYTHGLETGNSTETSMVPIHYYDEGLGAPSSYKANPQNSGFAKEIGGACYPDSRINFQNVTITYALTKGALETDKLHAVNCSFMVINTAFKESIDAKDEGSGETIGTICELQTETTDRKVYPIWSGTDMGNPYGSASNHEAEVDGLTTSQATEAVAFNRTTYYDALQFYDIAGKLKKVTSGLKWFTLTKNNPVKKFKIRLKSNVKRVNPYSGSFVLTHIPYVDTIYQPHFSGDTTNIPHVSVAVNTRFNEWNSSFDMDEQ